MNPLFVVNRIGWLFRIQSVDHTAAPPPGPAAQVVAGREEAFKLYRQSGGPGSADEFLRRSVVVDSVGRPAGPLPAAPAAGTTFFCPLQFPGLPDPTTAVPIVLSDGPYPKELREAAIRHRPMFHFDAADPARPSNVAQLFQQAGLSKPEQLYPDKGEPPTFVNLPAAGANPPAVYVHICVTQDGPFIRAFVQYYVFFLRSHVPLTDRGVPAERRPGDWQFAQIEFVKKIGEERFRPFTVGCSAHEIGHARFFDAAALKRNVKELVYPHAGLTRETAVVQADRPALYVGRGSHGLYFGPGAWRPAVTGVDESLCRAGGRAAALVPALFPARALALGPERIEHPTSYDPDPRDFIFLLDSYNPSDDKPAGPSFWLGWPGRFGSHPAATRGPKYRAPSNSPWVEDERMDLAWWSNPERFQGEFLKADYAPLLVTPISLEVIGPELRVALDRPLPAVGREDVLHPVYAPASLCSDGRRLADFWRATGELRCLRVLDTPAGRSPIVLRLLAPDRRSRPLPGEANVTLSTSAFELALAEIGRQDMVSVDIHLLGEPTVSTAGANPFPFVGDLLTESFRELFALLPVPLDGPRPGTLSAPECLRKLSVPHGTPLLAHMSKLERLLETMRRAAALFLGQASEAFLQLFSPANVGITMAALAFAAASQGTPIGWVCDLLLIASVGWLVFDVVDNMIDFLTIALYATTDADLDEAAAHLAHVVVTLGVTFVVELILKFRPSRSIRGGAVTAEPPPVVPGEPPSLLPAHPPTDPAFTYRGDRSGQTLPMEKLFSEGLSSKGTNMDLLSHVQSTNPESGYVATSARVDIAKGFAGRNGWVIVIRSRRGIDTVKALEALHPQPQQLEIAFPRTVPPEEIVGVYRMEQGRISGEFIPNSNYRNP